MKLITKQVADQPLTVTVEYPKLDDSAKRVIDKIRRMDISFVGRSDESSTKICIDDVYYFENVERKVFLYTDKDVFRLDGSMADIDGMAEETELVRVSRTCILNIDHLKEIRQIKNSHLEAVMDNDEVVIVSRKYLQDIKKAFRRM